MERHHFKPTMKGLLIHFFLNNKPNYHQGMFVETEEAVIRTG